MCRYYAQFRFDHRCTRTGAQRKQTQCRIEDTVSVKPNSEACDSIVVDDSYRGSAFSATYESLCEHRWYGGKEDDLWWTEAGRWKISGNEGFVVAEKNLRNGEVPLGVSRNQFRGQDKKCAGGAACLRTTPVGEDYPQSESGKPKASDPLERWR